MKKIIVPLLTILCIASSIMMIVALNNTKPEEPKFIPPEFDKSAISGDINVPKELGWSELYQDGMNFKVGICGNLIAKNDEAEVYFYNNENNNVWLKLRVLDETNNIIGETGLIKPSEYIQSIKFNSKINNGDKIKLKIMAYEPETYYSEGSIVLNTTIKTGG